MDNKHKPTEDITPESIDWASYHADNQQNIDIGTVANLVQRIGGELSHIDKQFVGSSPSRVEKIDKQKILSELTPENNTKSSPPNHPTPRQSENITQTNINHSPSSASISKVPITDDALLGIVKRLDRLESTAKAFKHARKIKRGVTYSVSSNSMRGQIKDADLIAELVLSELAKGVKTISIKLHENSDTK